MFLRDITLLLILIDSLVKGASLTYHFNEEWMHVVVDQLILVKDLVEAIVRKLHFSGVGMMYEFYVLYFFFWVYCEASPCHA